MVSMSLTTRKKIYREAGQWADLCSIPHNDYRNEVRTKYKQLLSAEIAFLEKLSAYCAGEVEKYPHLAKNREHLKLNSYESEFGVIVNYWGQTEQGAGW